MHYIHIYDDDMMMMVMMNNAQSHEGCIITSPACPMRLTSCVQFVCEGYVGL